MSSGGVICASALSTETDTARAMEQAIAGVLHQMDEPADLVLAFFTINHNAEIIARSMVERYSGATTMGCCGESIVSGDKEIERGSALTIWAARLPGVRRASCHLTWSANVDQGSFMGWTDELVGSWPEDSVMLLFGEPFTFPADRFASILNEEHPNIPLVGGMASGGDRPASNPLILNGRVCDHGAVALLLSGSLRARTIVSQGCRPVGQPFVITKADRNVIFELGGRQALEQLQSVFEQLNPADRAKIEGGIHVGRVIDEYKGQFDRGDFLVRNVIGADERTGAIAIGDYVRPGQTVQFHIRDAETADEDLRNLLTNVANDGPVAGALLFTCNGRGSRLFGEPDHDARIVSASLSGMPIAGFFAAGELGPVGHRNFLHGFTASVIVLG